MSKIIVGISGGVDSAYTLYNFKKDGHEVIAVYLNMLGVSEDEQKARRCAEETGCEFISVDCKEFFSCKVKDYFKSEYVLGCTPNPCVVCNKEVKLRLLYNVLKQLGADYMATGHYAKLYYDANNKRYGIGVADDITKDQSYMLWMLEQDVLSRLLLPLGTVNKSELRENAEFAGLSSARSKDSTDICFIPDGDHAKWLEENGVSDLPFGTFIHADGRLLGASKPIYNYTVGQRRGLGLAMDRSVYVVGVNAVSATVTVDYEDGLYKNSFKVRDLNFIGISGPDELTVPIYVKIRYKAKMQSCSVTFDGDICNVCGDAFKAVAPGQSAVFYDEDGHILFGGIICG